MSVEREAAEARFRAIHQECKGRPWKSLRAMPEALRACRDIYLAALREHGVLGVREGEA